RDDRIARAEIRVPGLGPLTLPGDGQIPMVVSHNDVYGRMIGSAGRAAAEGEQMLAQSMEALVLTGPNEFEIQTTEVPSPAAHEVLCKVHSVAICGTDKEIISGNFLKRGWPRGYPYTPGHEWSGEVIALGPDTEGFGFTVGDRVAGTAHSGCGYCRMCTIGRYTLCENYGNEERNHRHYGHYSTGALRQYHNSSVKSVFHIPDSMTLEQAALVDASSIALHAVKRGKVMPGDSVAIVGPGAQGLLAAQCAATMGAAQVIVVGRGPRLATAAALGAHIVDNSQVDGPQAVRDLTDDKGAHMTVDTAARGTSTRDAIAMTRRGGRVALIGVPLDASELPLGRLVIEEMDLYGVRANPGTCAEVIPLIAAGKIDVDIVTTHRFPLKDFGLAYETFTERIDGAIKVLVQPNAK
ncbi:MAG: zinc-dependent alcohol dehydrogenase, partial [Acidimicrobiia bacterium]